MGRTIHSNSINPVINGSITWSQESYSPAAVVLGGRFETETSFFTDASGLDNVQLDEMWTGTPNKATKETDGSTADAYTKFATRPDDVIFIDVDGPGGDDPTVYAHREVLNRTQDYGDGNAKSGFAMVDDSGTWKFSGDTSIQLQARISTEEISYVKFQSGNRGNEFDQKDKNKFFTGTSKGFFRLIAGSDPLGGFSDLEDGEFVAMTVSVADRFIKKTVFNSYRDSPDGTAVNEEVRNDQTLLNQFARNISIGNTVTNITGSMTILGRNYWTVGEIVDRVTNDYGSTQIGLAMTKIHNGFEPPRNAGDPSGDSTTIELGRF